MKSKIVSIGTATPPHRIQQMDVAHFMSNLLDLNAYEKQKLYHLYEASGIGYRHSVISDYKKNWESFSFYPPDKSLEPFPTTHDRMELYKEEALKLSLNAVNNCLNQVSSYKKEEITHLITVSCTGLYAPGLDVELVEALQLPFQVQRTGINFMGCYAAFNALKAADHICRANPEAKVLILCVELCTIHFQKEKDIENMLVNALFSDGAAAVLMDSDSRQGLNMQLENFYCDLAPTGKKDMTWDIGNHGFLMRLSPEVPAYIQRGIGQLCHNLLGQLDIPANEIDFFATHPGGKKILQVIEKELNITKQQNDPAYQVLYQNGNMSSPTVLFVLKHIWDQLETADQNKFILSFAFGPGLTLESMLLKVKWI